MRLRALDHVWRNSNLKGSALILLLAIADSCNAENTAWPSIAHLAKKGRMTTRNVQLLLKTIKLSGELKVRTSAGPNKENVYKIIL